jgi:hypothetical protein
MLTVSYYFLGLAISLLAAIFALTSGRRSGKRVEVELEVLRAATVCLPTGRKSMTDAIVDSMYHDLTWEEKARLNDTKTVWMRWYDRCKRKALEKQKVMYSWARTFALCSCLCLIGVLLEAQFDQPITLANVLAGFKRPCLVSACVASSPSLPAPSQSIQADTARPHVQ